MSDAEASAPPEKRFCSNCQSHIPLTNFTVHEIHCARNVRLCTQCKVGVSKSSWDDHQELYHREVPCEKCNTLVLPANQTNHVENECPNRQVKCDICEMDLFFKDFQVHHDYCSSRTEYCAGCKNYVKVVELESHECRPVPTARKKERDRDLPDNGIIPGPCLADLNATVSCVPCENCDEMINFTEYPVHLAICSIRHPDRPGTSGDAHVRLVTDAISTVRPDSDDRVELPTSSSAAGDLHPGSSKKQNGLNTVSEVPCEVCKRSVNFGEYNTHLRNCRRDPKSDEASGFTPKRKTSRRAKSPVNESSAESFLVSGVDTERQKSVNIPCELCNQMIDFALFGEHMLICTGSLLSSAMASEPQATETPEETIPCERCDRNIPVHKYQKHTLACFDTVDAFTEPSEETTTQCIHCKQNIGSRRFSEHLLECNREIPGTRVEIASPGIPCEFCEQLFPMEELEMHQYRCDKNPMSIRSRRSSDLGRYERVEDVKEEPLAFKNYNALSPDKDKLSYVSRSSKIDAPRVSEFSGTSSTSNGSSSIQRRSSSMSRAVSTSKDSSSGASTTGTKRLNNGLYVSDFPRMRTSALSTDRLSELDRTRVSSDSLYDRLESTSNIRNQRGGVTDSRIHTRTTSKPEIKPSLPVSRSVPKRMSKDESLGTRPRLLNGSTGVGSSSNSRPLPRTNAYGNPVGSVKTEPRSTRTGGSTSIAGPAPSRISGSRLPPSGLSGSRPSLYGASASQPEPSRVSGSTRSSGTSSMSRRPTGTSNFTASKR